MTVQIQVTSPAVYGIVYQSDLLSVVPEFVALAHGTTLQGTSKYSWSTPSGLTFTSFTKCPSWGADLYEDLV